MVRRRSNSGSFTLLGDIAQATGVQIYARWSEVLEHLGLSDVTIEELIHGYRVPAEIMEVAAVLLPLIAPDAATPVAHRHAGDRALVGLDQVQVGGRDAQLQRELGLGDAQRLAPLAQLGADQRTRQRTRLACALRGGAMLQCKIKN